MQQLSVLPQRKVLSIEDQSSVPAIADCPPGPPPPKGRLTGWPKYIVQGGTFAVVFGLFMFAAEPAFAQGGIGDVLANIITAVTDTIQSFAVGLGALGLLMWGAGKLARPVFPQISQMTANYIPDLMIGLAVVFTASQIVEGLAAVLGG
jgi:hypothetical protein